MSNREVPSSPRSPNGTRRVKWTAPSVLAGLNTSLENESLLIPLDKSQDKSMSRQTITQLYSRDNEESLFEEYQVERTPSIAEQFEESLKFRPNWSFIALMITMLWMQGWHYGYGLDTYNRLKHIL